MSKKTEYKLNRMKFNLKRYVFSGRYFVRNALIVMILLTVVAIGAVGFGLIGQGGGTEKVRCSWLPPLIL